MPRFYRSMYEQNGKPRTGDNDCELGVRPPGKRRADGSDVPADVEVVDGHIVPNGQGMSVFRSLADLPRLPARLIPRHLADRVRGAIGPSGLRIWRFGAGDFVNCPLTADLELRLTKPYHAHVCPSRSMTVADLQARLALTRDDWALGEP